MSITITAWRMTSDQTQHWAVPTVAGDEYGSWVVSWLPDEPLNRNQAITAMTIAEAVTRMRQDGRAEVVDHTHELWPHIDNWAVELGLTGADAVVRASDPPHEIATPEERAR